MKAPSTTRGGLARREQSFVVTSNGRRNDSSPSDNDALVLDSDTALDLDLMKHLLPPELHDLIGPFETMQKRLASRQGPNGSPTAPPDAHALEQLARSQANCPTAADGDKPFRHNRLARNPYRSPPWYPQQPLALFDDPAWYKTLETDTLFFIFYYRQGTYHQHLAAKALKAQSWRFHKRFQTWFQRHEEPKVIVEDYEQGTYRFFDYESTWMNRRKADFQFEYRYLEDELV